MKHEYYKTMAMIITAAKTNMCEMSIPAQCVWVRSERILCSTQKSCLDISHCKIPCTYFTLSGTLVLLLIFTKIHGFRIVDMQTNSDHVENVVPLLDFN